VKQVLPEVILINLHLRHLPEAIKSADCMYSTTIGCINKHRVIFFRQLHRNIIIHVQVQSNMGTLTDRYIQSCTQFGCTI